MADLLEMSFCCMEGVSLENVEKKKGPITNVPNLIDEINAVYASMSMWEAKKQALLSIFDRVELSTQDVNKYSFWDPEKPYTRNLMATDGKNYTLLMLCWNAGRESKIHDHPGEGCFVKTIRGVVRETRYELRDDEVRQVCTKFFCENQVSFINDNVGLHKIGNPQKDSGTMTMHLYTPPFQSCKVWAQSGVGQAQRTETAVMGFYSAFGLRTPQLEGRPGPFAKVLSDIVSMKRGDRVNRVEPLVDEIGASNL